MIPSLPHRSSLMRASVVALAVLAPLGEAAAETKVKPGFNVFSVNQDIEIGRQSAAEAERQLRMVRDRSVDDYLNQIVGQLAAGATGARFPYHAQAVNAKEINAFALPGGPLYVNSGLITSAHSEGELAGVIAHEMAHIALRHATHNVSKAYIAQAGVGILGGVLGGRNGASTSQIINAAGGFGLNTLFLKYSRDAETQADVMGAQMMARAGYDPFEMASFFDLLREQAKHDPGRLEQFFSSHPAPADRAARIRQEAQSLGASSGTRVAAVGGFDEIQARVGREAAGSRGRLDRRQARTDDRDRGGYGGYGDDRGVYGDDRRGGGYGDDDEYGASGRRPVDVAIDRPASRFRRFEPQDGSFEVQYPENWRVQESRTGLGVTLAPEGGIVGGDRDGQAGVVYGVIIDRFDPSRAASLEQATDDLVDQLTRGNTYLRRSSQGPRREVVDGARALSVTLSGRSPLTGQDERVTVFARELRGGGLLYTLLIAPSREYGTLDRTFQRMVDSLRVDDAAARR